ncbi:transposase, partial [Endozoicomonas ascidiicola]|uniref:transposase n=1 Tax=Endozoicomonas ascidiicola TaxID=1698521 RepID=UPI0015616750
TIEPTFGIQKEVMGYRQFLVRGLEAVSAEWDLLCMGFNLKRMFTLMLKDLQESIIFMQFISAYRLFVVFIWIFGHKRLTT